MEEDEPPPGLEPAHDADLRAAQELAAAWAAEEEALRVAQSEDANEAPRPHVTRSQSQQALDQQQQVKGLKHFACMIPK